ncbi:IS3-like element ISPar1 family transposase, partial [Psychrobacter sp. 1U2]
HQFTRSMSGRGNCFDNPPIESFWGILKNDIVYHQDYQTPRQMWFEFYSQAA